MRIRMTLEIEVAIYGDYDPGCEAYISGLPEDCYPAEPDMFEPSGMSIMLKNEKGNYSREIKLTGDVLDAMFEATDPDDLDEQARQIWRDEQDALLSERY